MVKEICSSHAQKTKRKKEEKESGLVICFKNKTPNDLASPHSVPLPKGFHHLPMAQRVGLTRTLQVPTVTVPLCDKHRSKCFSAHSPSLVSTTILEVDIIITRIYREGNKNKRLSSCPRSDRFEYRQTQLLVKVHDLFKFFLLLLLLLLVPLLLAWS